MADPRRSARHLRILRPARLDRPACGEGTRIFLHRVMELTMGQIIKPDSLHRTAKYFMDNGRADTHEDAMTLLDGFGLTIFVGQEIAGSVHQQTALLTLVNAARRTLLGGIDVVGLPDAPSLTPLAHGQPLAEAVRDYGGGGGAPAPTGGAAAL